MSVDRWTRIERIYHAALEQAPCDRASYVRRQAGADTDLAAEIEALLAYDERPAAFMEHSAIELAARGLAARADSDQRPRYSGRISSYEILRPVAAGGMGEVYLARDTRLARNVALKMLPDPAGPDWVAAFRHEALAASALNHPNIVTIYEIGEHEGTKFIAAEYADGVTLRERLKGPPIPASELVEIALQIADGLGAAHDAGVVHRDIKPENVMLRADGLVKILDFGIATMRGVDFPLAPPSAGPNGVVIGTSGYMSPEQSRGLAVDSRTDVWSLGIVIHEMATGRLPATPAHEYQEDATREFEFAALAHYPPELVRIVQRTLSSEPAERYANARELAGDLRVLRRVLENSGHPATARRQTGGPNAAVVRTLSAALILVAATASVLIVGWRSREDPAIVAAGTMPRTQSPGGGDTSNPAAFQLYAKGRYHVLKRTPGDIRKGVQYLREAVTVDPLYARAHAKLADAYILMAMTSDVAPNESFPHARMAAQRALAIDPALSEARVSMGIIKFWFDWDWSGAEAEFTRAIAAERPDPAAHAFYGHLLSNLGDHTRALQEMRRALDYEPHSALTNALFAQCIYYEGRYDASLAHLQKTIELDPALWLTHNMMGRIYGLKGMYREALREFDRATELGGSLIVTASAGYTLAASGRREEARAILDTLKTRAAQTYVPPSNLALVHLGLGEHEKALDQLEAAVDARDLLLTFLAVEPRWAALADSPRFTAVLAKVGLKR